MQNNPPQSGSHAGAATTYGTHAQKNTSDPREVEARVLLKAANMMQDLQNNWNADNMEQIDETLKYNRQVWMIFYDTAVENKDGNRPDDLRSNIINLANFVFKRTVEILGNPQKDKLEALITINRNIAAGLMQAPANAGQMPGAASQTTHTSA